MPTYHSYVSESINGGGSPNTFTISVPSLTDGLAVIYIHAADGAVPTFTTLTLDGNSVTNIGQRALLDTIDELYVGYIVNPSTGDLVVSWTGASFVDWMTCFVVFLEGVDQTTPMGNDNNGKQVSSSTPGDAAFIADRADSILTSMMVSSSSGDTYTERDGTMLVNYTNGGSMAPMYVAATGASQEVRINMSPSDDCHWWVVEWLDVSPLVTFKPSMLIL